MLKHRKYDREETVREPMCQHHLAKEAHTMRVHLTGRLGLWAVATAVVAMAGTSALAQNTVGAPADTRLETSNKIWAKSDTCGKESFQKFPDYTAEGAAKRDAYMRECLRKNRLPPRNDLAQSLKPK
jgi:hypothetical protein